MTEIEWDRTGPRTHRVTISRSADQFPPPWNRSYRDGALVCAAPPYVDDRGNTFVGCSFLNFSLPKRDNSDYRA